MKIANYTLKITSIATAVFMLSLKFCTNYQQGRNRRKLKIL